MSGTRSGAEKTTAMRAGLSVSEYRARVADGLKRCTRCELWLALHLFGGDATRGDGLDASCRRCRSERSRAAYTPRPRKRGRRYAKARDGDKLQARGRVNHLVNIGVLDDPNDVPCKDCGHRTGQVDAAHHEYDHHLGYSAEHHEHVQAVCAPCHHAREKARGVHLQRARGARGRFVGRP